MDCDAVALDVPVRRRDPEKLAGVHAAADDAADDEVALRDLERDLMTSGRCPAEECLVRVGRHVGLDTRLPARANTTRAGRAAVAVGRFEPLTARTLQVLR